MNARVCLTGLAILLAVGQSGCATLLSAALGAAVCGDSSGCVGDFVSAGAAADVAMASAAVDAVTNAPEVDEDAWASYDDADHADADHADADYAEFETAGGEATLTSESGAYYHCVDADGHHVVELVAPSEFEARLVCVAELGYGPSDAGVDELCICRSRS